MSFQQLSSRFLEKLIGKCISKKVKNITFKLHYQIINGDLQSKEAPTCFGFHENLENMVPLGTKRLPCFY